MRPGQDIALIFAAVFLSLAVWRECIWWSRSRRWKKTVGTVRGFRTDGDGPTGPIIIYSTGGHEKTFESAYCLSNPNIGSEVDVMFDPDTENAVMVTQRHRWFPTLLCATLFLLMLFLAALSK